MTVMVASRPIVVHEVTGSQSGEGRPPEGFGRRTVGLAAAGYLLHVPVADFDCVWLAAALEDIKCCPCCRGHPRRTG